VAHPPDGDSCRVEQGAAVDWYRRMDNNHGFGQYGIPCFAEILFDGRVLPPFHEAWPQSVRNHYHSIAAAVDGGLPRPTWRK